MIKKGLAHESVTNLPAVAPINRTFLWKFVEIKIF